MSSAVSSRVRSAGLDTVKTVAIFGTVMIHATAVGGFNWALGSPAWTANLFWSTLLRCAVPLFLMCSGALFLTPQRELPIGTLWKKYILRILVALAFWAAAYLLWGLYLAGNLTWAGLAQAARDFFKFRHRDHLYYLVIMVVVYAALPLTRLFTAQAGRTLMTYGLGLWLVCGSLLPTLFAFWPFARMEGFVRQYAMQFTWMAIGFGVLGWLIHTRGSSLRPRTYALLYLGGFSLTFFGTWLLSLRWGELSGVLLQGNAPGVVMEAAGLFGLCAHRNPAGKVRTLTETLSRSSFCIYLVHLFFLDRLVLAGYYTGTLFPLWAAPVETLFLVLCGFVTWLILKRIPWVNRYLI
ncbi:acyltransferase [Evtepia sp.]|uniref:acyltransferase n=1 Tax=Evtepia sp. TaxID=2773933 RepID=UPI003F190201